MKRKKDISDQYESIRNFNFLPEPQQISEYNHKYMNMKPYVVTQLQNYSMGISGDYFHPPNDEQKKE